MATSSSTSRILAARVMRGCLFDQHRRVRTARRDGHLEFRPAVWMVLGRDSTCFERQQAAGDRQPHARARRAARLSASEEPIEETGQFLGGNSWTAVPDGDEQAISDSSTP